MSQKRKQWLGTFKHVGGFFSGCLNVQPAVRRNQRETHQDTEKLTDEGSYSSSQSETYSTTREKERGRESSHVSIQLCCGPDEAEDEENGRIV